MHFIILVLTGLLTYQSFALHCPQDKYSTPYRDGINRCVICSHKSNTTNITLCRVCDPSTRTVGDPTGSLNKCSCVGTPTNTSCYPFNDTVIPTVVTYGNTALFKWERTDQVNTSNSTIFGRVIGYRISVLLNQIVNFTKTLNITNSSYNHTFAYNVTYDVITELEVSINNYSYLGPPYSFNITLQPWTLTTSTPVTLIPAAESAIITFAIIIMIMLMSCVVFIFICTVMFPYGRLSKRSDRFTLNLDTRNTRHNKLNEGFTSIYQSEDIPMDVLNQRDSGDISYFVNPYLAVDTTEIDSDN